jgi:hypothetical protein
VLGPQLRVELVLPSADVVVSAVFRNEVEKALIVLVVPPLRPLVVMDNGQTEDWEERSVDTRNIFKIRGDSQREARVVSGGSIQAAMVTEGMLTDSTEVVLDAAEQTLKKLQRVRVSSRQGEPGVRDALGMTMTV